MIGMMQLFEVLGWIFVCIQSEHVGKCAILG
jgi:hypothetical protein